MMTPKPGFAGGVLWRQTVHGVRNGDGSVGLTNVLMSAVLDTTMPRTGHDSTWASWSLWWSVD